MERRARRRFPGRVHPLEERQTTRRRSPSTEASISMTSRPPRALPSAEPPIEDDLQARREEIARLQERALHEQETVAAEARRARAPRAGARPTASATSRADRGAEAAEAGAAQGARAALRPDRRQAKQMLIADVEHDARRQAGRAADPDRGGDERDADRRARNILSIAMGRLAGSHASETTTRLIELPSEEMKGRIIGREGRNIRAIEALTGVDLIIDETPNAVVLSSFDGSPPRDRPADARAADRRRADPAGRRSRRSTRRPRRTSRRRWSPRASGPSSRPGCTGSTRSCSRSSAGSASAPPTGRTSSTT